MMHGDSPALALRAGSKGYSFATWLRLETVERAPTRAGRALFTLLCRSGGAARGVAAFVRGTAHDSLARVMHERRPQLA